MIPATAGHDFDALLEGAATGLEGTLGVRLADPTAEETLVARTTSGINEYPAGSGVYGATLTAPDWPDDRGTDRDNVPWKVAVVWDDGETYWVEDLYLYPGAIPDELGDTLATADDVAARLGRDLTPAEITQAEAAIAATTGLIATEVGLTAVEVVAINPRPGYLKTLCVEKAVAVIVNPHGLAASSEQLGQWQHSETYPRAADIGLFLSDGERRRIRRAVRGGAFQATSFETPYSGTALDDEPDLVL